MNGKGPNGVVFNGQFTANSATTMADPTNPEKQIPAVVGQLTGTLKGGALGQGQQSAQQVEEQITLPAAIQQASCQVLNLVLGPLHLNLLGLEVDLNQVV